MEIKNEAVYIIAHGNVDKAFALRPAPMPVFKADEVRIEVEAFGLNFADVMARRGQYRDAPPLPAIVGYEVVGKIVDIGQNVKDLKVGTRVLSFTRFGGYARFAVAPAAAVVPIEPATDAGEALALATQYCTAYYAAEMATTIQPGEHILIQAAAGGVGIALTQIAKHRGAIIYGTAGSQEKIEFLRQQGVHHPINYRKEDYTQAIRKLRMKEGLDIVFDSLGGADFGKGFRLLGAGGRMVGFGAASSAGEGNKVVSMLQTLVGFGLYSPIELIMNSKSIIGVNMLRVADSRPQALAACMKAIIEKYQAGIFKPYVGGRFSVQEIGQAHTLLESRQSIGKIAVFWD